MDVDRQIELLTAGAVDVISEADLRKKLERGKPLRVKLGIDPTASDIHLGFAVVLRRMRLFEGLDVRADRIAVFKKRLLDLCARLSGR